MLQINDPKTDPAKQVRFDELNVQTQSPLRSLTGRTRTAASDWRWARRRLRVQSSGLVDRGLGRPKVQTHEKSAAARPGAATYSAWGHLDGVTGLANVMRRANILVLSCGNSI